MNPSVTILYFSLTGKTKEIALQCRNALGDAEVIEVEIGWLAYILNWLRIPYFQWIQKRKIPLSAHKNSMLTSDVLLICTPVWFNGLPYLLKKRIGEYQILSKSVLAICTYHSSQGRVFDELNAAISPLEISRKWSMSNDTHRNDSIDVVSSILKEIKEQFNTKQ